MSFYSKQPVRRAEAHLDLAIRVLYGLGLSTEVHKEQRCLDVVTSTGVEYNAISGRMRLAEAKRVRYAKQISAIRNMKVCPRSTFKQMQHRLLHAARVYPLIRQYLWAVFRAAKAK